MKIVVRDKAQDKKNSDFCLFWGGLCSESLLQCMSFSCFQARALEPVSSPVVAWTSFPQGMWDLSSLARACTRVLCTERQILNP